MRSFSVHHTPAPPQHDATYTAENAAASPAHEEDHAAAADAASPAHEDHGASPKSSPAILHETVVALDVSLRQAVRKLSPRDERFRALCTLAAVGDAFGYNSGNWEFCGSTSKILNDIVKLNQAQQSVTSRASLLGYVVRMSKLATQEWNSWLEEGGCELRSVVRR